MKCFYHTDMDGKCAGAIVKKMFGRGEYRPINYKDEFPFGEIEKNEDVVIVDFSLQGDGDFERLLEITERVVWIDHHKTAIEKHAHLEGRIDGIRRDGISGCELAWEYFYQNRPVPQVVRLLGDYDIWAFNYGDDTEHLQSGIRLYSTDAESLNWNRWLSPDYEPKEEIEAGRIATKYRDSYYAGLVKEWSFRTTFEGHPAIACNACSVSSQLFDTADGEFDLMIPFAFDGGQWTISLYTTKEGVDVSEIAKKYGGGGHNQAAGFQCEELPFKREEVNA